MGVKSFDHVSVVVDDLEAATTFFLDRGPEGIIVELAERIGSQGPSTEQ